METEEAASGLRARIGLIGAPLAFLAVWAAPLPLDDKPHRVAALTAAVVVSWVTEFIPVTATALLIAPMLVALGVCDAKTAFAPYADPLLFLFYASFFIAEAMSRHGLDRRLADALMRSPYVASDPSRARIAVMALGGALSMWMSNTTATVIVLPILLGTISSVASSKGKSARAGGLIGIAYACSVGGMGTPVGTPPNMIAVRMLETAGVHIGFLDWMMIGIPASLVTFALSCVVVQKLLPIEAGLEAVQLSAERRSWSRGEKITALAFMTAVLGWIIPELLAAAKLEGSEAVLAALPASCTGLFASTLLFAARVKPGGEAVLPWSAARNADWGVIMLFGGGIALGSQMFESGLSSAIGRGFSELTGTLDVWTLTAAAIALTVAMSELTSNTATANMLLPIVLAIAHEMNVSPIPPALGVGLAATCGFMLPVATGPNALVYGTGYLTVGQMMRVGIVFDLCCIVALFIVLRVLCPLYGWT